MSHAAKTFIDRMGHAAESDGFSPIAGRLFGVLLLSAEPLSLDELAETLGVSKASVSTDARRLLERGIVERVSRPGDRRDYYELAPDFFAQIIRSRISRWRRLHDLARAMKQEEYIEASRFIKLKQKVRASCSAALYLPEIMKKYL